MVNGQWSMVNGQWSMVNGQWSMVNRTVKIANLKVKMTMEIEKLTRSFSFLMSAISPRETRVYRLAFEQAMEIFEISKSFPKEEVFSLTDQVRRSSRSVCICLLEAWSKRRYPAHFVAKATDADMENAETLGWIDFSLGCGYIAELVHNSLVQRNQVIGKLLAHMIHYPERY
jgi:four helix bundle protein